MSDLSLPPLTLLPLETGGGAAPGLQAQTEPAGPFAWPSPPVGRYAPGLPLTDPEPCEVEGLNGRLMRVQLVRFDGAAGMVEVLSPGLRTPLPLRFAQFRRLLLATPLPPEGTTPADAIHNYQLRLKNGSERTGLTVGHFDTGFGLFLYEPLDNDGAVRRVFVPNTAYESAQLPNAGYDATAWQPRRAVVQAPPSTGAIAPTAASLAAAEPAAVELPPLKLTLHDIDLPSATTSHTSAGAASATPAVPSPPRAAATPDVGTPLPELTLDLPETPASPKPRKGAARPSAATGPATATPGPAAAVAAPAAPPVAPTAVPPNAPGTAPSVPSAAAAAGIAAAAPVPAAAATPARPAAAQAQPAPASPASASTPAPAAPAAPARGKSASEVLLGKQVTTPDELLEAVERQAKMPMLRMGEALIALGLITDTQLGEALTLQKQDRGTPLGEILVRKGWIKRHDLQHALVRKMGYPVIDLARFEPETEALSKVSYQTASRLQTLPLMIRGGRLFVATEDPTRVKALDELEFGTGCKVVPSLVLPGQLSPVMDAVYQKMGAEVVAARMAQAEADGEIVDASELLASLEMQGGEGEAHSEEPTIEQSDNSLVRLINQMILEAQSRGVSDIHIESQPGREKVRIRFRQDGALRPYMELPHTYRSALMARIKIMCDLDISEKRKPQDGKIAFGKFHAGSKLELRVATIPTSNGLEDAVLRLLASAKPMPIDDIGLAPRNLHLLKDIVARPYGMFLCVGPTGSGKTTTLHSALGYINQPDRKIWTAEDPVEITQPGLRQVQVNPKIDWTFAKALRAFLRADPDVIMVGEIRDNETATVAVESSLTGHLVLSTLHTNSAPETVTRLLDMGMDPFNFADALLGVLAQRLVRRICGACKTSRDATPAEIEELMGDYLNAFGPSEHKPAEADVMAAWTERFGKNGRLQHYHGTGCEKCGNSGLRGRAGVHELMAVSRDVRRLIQTGARVDELQKAAMAEGMLTLRQDGIEKVLLGVTTIGEVRSSTN